MIAALFKTLVKLMGLMVVLAAERSLGLPLLFITFSWLLIARYRQELWAVALVWIISVMLAVAYMISFTLSLVLVLGFVIFQEYGSFISHQTVRLMVGVGLFSGVLMTQVGTPQTLVGWLVLVVSALIVFFVSRALIFISHQPTTKWWRRRRVLSL